MSLHPHSYENFFNNFPNTRIGGTNLDSQWVIQLKQYIMGSLPDNIPDVGQLARYAHFSPRQLTRKLKATIGLTPAKFIREVQLQLALQLMIEKQFDSVSEVAYRCGFDYLSTFSAVFKQRFGVPPRELQVARRGSLSRRLTF